MVRTNDTTGKRMRKTGTIIVTVGLLMIMAALLLTAYNLWCEWKGGKQAEEALARLEEQMEIRQEEKEEEKGNVLESQELPLYEQNPDMEMPICVIDGMEYIGILTIPSLNLSLPVIHEWSYPNLRQAPCRYKGSIYKGDMIIAAHSYKRHFGLIKNLVIDDAVQFTDVEGNVFQYRVAEIQELTDTAVEEMEAGDWDLTLFTCTYSTKNRVTIRCEQIRQESGR